MRDTLSQRERCETDVGTIDDQGVMFVFLKSSSVRRYHHIHRRKRVHMNESLFPNIMRKISPLNETLMKRRENIYHARVQ